jgi:hypothetical protein
MRGIVRGLAMPGGGGGGGGGITALNFSAGTTSNNISDSIVFADSNNISFGLNGSTITASAAAGGGGITNIRVSAGTTSNLLSALTFADSNGLAFGINASTITGSYTVPVVTNSSWTVSDAATSGTVGRLAFTNLNGVTLSLSTGAGGSHTIVGSITSQSAQSAIKGFGASNTGNTAGNTGLSTGIDWVMAGSNNITISESTAVGGPNTLWVSGPSVGGAQTGISGIANSQTTYTSGTVSLSDQANITIASSVNGATQIYRFSVAAQSTQPAVNALGASNVGNTAGNTGTSSGITWVLAGSNQATISESTAGGGPNTLWVNVTTAAQTTQPAVNAFGVSNTGNTAGNTGTSSGITWVLGGSNAVTLSQSTAGGGPNTVWIQGPVSATTISQVTTANVIGTRGSRFALEDHQHLGIAALAAGSNTGNTAGNTATQPGGTWVIAGSSPITISGSSGAAGIHTAWIQMSQTNQQITMFATSNTTQSSTGTTNASSLIFAGAGIASVGITNGSVLISVPSGGGAGDGGVFAGVSTMGNTAGSTGTVSTGNFVLVGTGAMTLSQSTGAAGSAATVTLSVPQTSSLSATGFLSISTNGSTISIGAGPLSFFAVGNTTQSSSGTIDGRSISFSGAGDVSVGISNGSVVISGDPPGSSYQNFIPVGNSSVLTWNGASVSDAVAFNVPIWVSASFIRIPALMTTNSTTIATMASATASAQGQIASTLNFGIYSLGTGASSKSLMSVTTATTGFSFSQKISVTNSTQASYSLGLSFQAEGGGTSLSTQYSVSNTNYSFTTDQFTAYTSVRFIDIPFAASLAEGNYWAIIGLSTSSSSAGAAGLAALTNCNVRYSAHYGASFADLSFGVMGSTNRTSGGLMGAGSFSTAGGGTTSALPISAISSRASLAIPYFQMLRSA